MKVEAYIQPIKQIKTFKTVYIDRLRKLESGLNAEESLKEQQWVLLKDPRYIRKQNFNKKKASN